MTQYHFVGKQNTRDRGGESCRNSSRNTTGDTCAAYPGARTHEARNG